jgi:hypothetical protein
MNRNGMRLETNQSSGSPLTRPSATLSLSEGEREGVRGKFRDSMRKPSWGKLSSHYA